MSASKSRRFPFQLATLCGAYLLFLVQPLIAKQILPWFGGATVVWSTCLVFFQFALLVGYAYAHVTRRLGLRRQIALHIGLLALTFLTLPIAASAAWKPPNADAPVWRLLVLLTIAVGAPYAMLATTAPLLQDWYRRVIPEGTPHRLYALSNAGSLAALASYPLIVEPALSLREQSLWWSAAFAVFAVACAGCAWTVWHTSPRVSVNAVLREVIPVASRVDRFLWVVLAAVGSGLLVAVTNQLCQDVAAVPLLWVLPLAIYLMTFIVCFAGWYSRRWWAVIYAGAFAATAYALGLGTIVTIPVQAGALLLVLAAGAMSCHGELVRLRPHAAQLTAFYVAIALGGSVGGIFVALIAPVVFVTYAELPLLLLMAPALLLVAAHRDMVRAGKHKAPIWVLGVPVAVFCIAGGLVLHAAGDRPRTVAMTRNFYGRLAVVDDDPMSKRPLRGLFHGRILHGAQFLQSAIHLTPTTYYAKGSGIDVALNQHTRRLAGQPLRVGVIGLGAGTIAAWGRSGDRFRFFELDPDVVDFARRYFTFLSDTRADVDVVTGDARLSLEREVATADGRHTYDVLAVDAFSGDSIPVHLLTRECFALYRRALTPEGVLAVHVTNQFLDLRRVVRGLAADDGLQVVEIDRPADHDEGVWTSVWMLVTEDGKFLHRASAFSAPASGSTPSRVVWTDAFSSLVSVLR
jgi:hypothetical protein